MPSIHKVDSQKVTEQIVEPVEHPVSKLAKRKLAPAVPSNLPVRFFKDIKSLNFSLLAIVNKVNYLIGANFNPDKKRMTQFSARINQVLRDVIQMSQKMGDALRGRKDFSDRYYQTLVKFHSVIQEEQTNLFKEPLAEDLGALDRIEDRVNKHFDNFKHAFIEETSK